MNDPEPSFDIYYEKNMAVAVSDVLFSFHMNLLVNMN